MRPSLSDQYLITSLTLWHNHLHPESKIEIEFGWEEFFVNEKIAKELHKPHGDIAHHGQCYTNYHHYFFIKNLRLYLLDELKVEVVEFLDDPWKAFFKGWGYIPILFEVLRSDKASVDSKFKALEFIRYFCVPESVKKNYYKPTERWFAPKGDIPIIIIREVILPTMFHFCRKSGSKTLMSQADYVYETYIKSAAEDLGLSIDEFEKLKPDKEKFDPWLKT